MKGSFYRYLAVIWSSLSLGLTSALGLGITKVQLKNGDRVSGELIRENDDAIYLEHAIFGELRVERESIKRIERPKPSAAAKKPDSDSNEEPSEGKKSSIAKTPLSILGIITKSVQLDNWQQRLEFGMTSQAGRKDRTDFTFRYDMRRRAGKNDYRMQARMYYGETNNETSTDKLNSNFRWRRDIAPGVFYQSTSTYSFDGIKGIDTNLEQKFGLGYRLFNSREFKLSTGAGASGRYRDVLGLDDEFDYLVDWFEDLDYRLNDRFRISQDIRLALPPQESGEYELEFSAAMISEITDALNFSVRYQFEYDKSLAKDRREDQRFISAIGYSF